MCSGRPQYGALLGAHIPTGLGELMMVISVFGAKISHKVVVCEDVWQVNGTLAALQRAAAHQKLW